MFALFKDQKHPKGVLEFSFNTKEATLLDWENENEFRYHNEMYDVIEKKAEGGRLVIRCIADQHETELVNEYQRNNKQHRSGEWVVQLITASFILPQAVSVNQFEGNVKNRYFNYSSSLQRIASLVLAPPPDVC